MTSKLNESGAKSPQEQQMLPDEEEAVADVRRRFSAAFAEMDRTLAAVLQMIVVGEWAIRLPEGVSVDMRVVRLAQVQLAKACKTFRAIQIVCERGLGQDAGVLLRTLFETTLQVLWLFAEDSIKRARLLVAQQAQRMKVRVREFEQLDVTGDDLDGIRIAMHEHWDSSVVGLTQEEVSGVLKHWGGGISAVCQQLKTAHPGLPVLYTTLYRETSGFAHGSDLLAHAFLENDSFVIGISPGDFGLPSTPRLARLMLVGLAAEIDERLGLDFKERLDAVRPPNY